MLKSINEYARHEKTVLSDDIASVDSRLFDVFGASDGKTVAVPVGKRDVSPILTLSDNLEDAKRPDIGTVLSCGDGCGYETGDTVAFAHGLAFKVADFYVDDGLTIEEVWFFGCIGDSCENVENEMTMAPRPSPPEEYALMKKSESGKTQIGWVPLNRKVVIEIPEPEESSGLILLPDTAKVEPVNGFVVATGPKVKNYSIGDEVLYLPSACTRVSYGGKRLLVTNEEHLYGIVRN